MAYNSLLAGLVGATAVVACGSTIVVTDGEGADGEGAGTAFGKDDDGGEVGKEDDGGKPVGASGSGAGSGSGSSGSSGSGGLAEPSKECWECLESVDDKELCAPQAEACYDDLACATLLACYEECGYWGPCMAECNEIVIGGVEAVTELMQCVACDVCTDPCAGSSLSPFCS
ncbi:MAG: hypothetical protein RIF41_37240 [Polyangiaceae bacterium]